MDAEIPEDDEPTGPEELVISIPQHPLGIRPLGNQYLAKKNAKIFAGTFRVLPDEVLVILLEYFNSSVLLLLGSTCKYLHAFSKHDDLWKSLFVKIRKIKLRSLLPRKERLTLVSTQNSRDIVFTWLGNWRSTYLNLSCGTESTLQCHNIFSDFLYRPFLCAYTPIDQYACNVPRCNIIPRFDNLSSTEFSESWSTKPFILTQPTREWPIFELWNVETLRKQYRHIKFRAESVDWSLDDYVSYMKNNSDESPLYLFDKNFVDKMGLTIGRNEPSTSYWIPECFGEDLFAVLGDQRPDFRWLIIGPERSGSSFHKDPNATSAWNAVIRGSKYWMIIPSSSSSPLPPGVFVSKDQSEVTSPLSIAEWLLDFHTEARNTPGCMEGVCREGEVLHVPSGWWHLVVNLEPAIAITQNFVPRRHLSGVLNFLRDKPDQVSGFKKSLRNPYSLFIDRMRAEYPDLLNQALHQLEMKAGSQKRKWNSLVGVHQEAQSFSFGFGGDGDDEVP